MDPEISPIERLVELLEARQPVVQEDQTLMGLDLQSGSSASVRGAAARERLMGQARQRPGRISAEIAENTQRRLGRDARPNVPSEPLAHLERFGSFSDRRDLGMIAWVVRRALG